MKLPWVRSIVALGAILGVAHAVPVQANVIASNVVTVATANGSIRVDSSVDDDFFGDGRLRFLYQVSGDYDPLSPDTNGISSLQIGFGAIIEDVTDQTGPAGWELNTTSLEPPLGAGWDLPNSVGYGVGPNSGDVFFYFAVPAGTGFTSVANGSYAGSHFFDVPFGLVSLVDAASGQGPIVPVPEPASLLLLGGGIAVLARRGR